MSQCYWLSSLYTDMFMIRIQEGNKCNKIVNVYSPLITPTQLSSGNYLTIFHDSIPVSKDVHNKTQILLLILLLPTEYMDLHIYFIYHGK